MSQIFWWNFPPFIIECKTSSFFLHSIRMNGLVFPSLQTNQIISLCWTQLPGRVARTAQPMVIDDCYKIPFFDQDIDKQTGFHTTSMMCLPIMGVDFQVIISDFLSSLLFIDKRSSFSHLICKSTGDCISYLYVMSRWLQFARSWIRWMRTTRSSSPSAHPTP